MKSTNGQLIWKQIQDLIDNKHVFPAQVNHNNFYFFMRWLYVFYEAGQTG